MTDVGCPGISLCSKLLQKLRQGIWFCWVPEPVPAVPVLPLLFGEMVQTGPIFSYCSIARQKVQFQPEITAYTTTTVAPLLSRSFAHPRRDRTRKAVVYTISLGKQGKRIYTIGPVRKGSENKEGFHFHAGVACLLPPCPGPPCIAYLRWARTALH